MIVNTFKEMTEKNGCQIIITTHVPGLAALLPIQSLRYITNSEGSPEVAVGTEDAGILARVADTLGVLPDLTPPLAPQYHDCLLYTSHFLLCAVKFLDHFFILRLKLMLQARCQILAGLIIFDDPVTI